MFVSGTRDIEFVTCWFRVNMCVQANWPCCCHAWRVWKNSLQYNICRAVYMSRAGYICEGLPGGGGGGPCSLVPFQNCPMFQCSHTLSECFRTVIFRILFPCSQKLANVPLFPSIFYQCSLVPQNPWETLI